LNRIHVGQVSDSNQYHNVIFILINSLAITELEDERTSQVPKIQYTHWIIEYLVSKGLNLTYTEQKLFAQCYGQVRRNAHAIRALIRANAKPVYALEGIKSQFEYWHEDMNDDYVEMVIGHGIYQHLSMLNHSCLPNALVISRQISADTCTQIRHIIDTDHVLKPAPNPAIYHGADLVVRLLTQVNADEMITISYGPVQSEMNYEQRQAWLEERYGFKCQCQACR
jgi:hypothetical protein